MYYSQLRAFHAVATQGGFSKAADHLHLTQPTLSDQVRKLERDFDILLFNRTSRSVALTDAGRHLLAITNRMFECEGEAIEYLKESQNLLVGSLTLSADAPFHVLRIVRAFRNRYPGVTVNPPTSCATSSSRWSWVVTRPSPPRSAGRPGCCFTTPAITSTGS